MERTPINSSNIFSIEINERKIPPGNIPLHWHEFYEIEIYLSGEGVMHLNNTDYDIKADTLFFLTPADFHSYAISKDVHLINLTFPAHCIEYSQIQDLLLLTHFFAANIKNETTQRLTSLIKQISIENSSPKYMSRQYLSNLLSCLIIDLLRLEKQQDRHKIYTDRLNYPIAVQKAMYYIISSFKEQITLESAAEVAGISPSYLSKVFHKYTGNGFHEFLVNLRLDHSRQLLLYTNETITNIAYYCGFNSSSYYLRSFKNKYGISPLGYRKKANS